jgi:hypothetical protein
MIFFVLRKWSSKYHNRAYNNFENLSKYHNRAYNNFENDLTFFVTIKSVEIQYTTCTFKKLYSK